MSTRPRPTSSDVELRARLERAEQERDQALGGLALARAELDALKLALKSRGEPEPALYPNDAAPGLAPPLRYVVVDYLNDALKALTGPLSRRLRGRRPNGDAR